MAQVFISYSSAHRELTEELAARLEAAGLSVWWDRRLTVGGAYAREITQQLDDADAVIVLWSKGSVSSDWVYAEAQRAGHQRKLLPLVDLDLQLDRIPLPFSALHMLRVDAADADLLAAVRRILNGDRTEDIGQMADAEGGGWLLDHKNAAPSDRIVKVTPATLLQPRFRVIPFTHFDNRQQLLMEWAAGTPGAQHVRLAGRLIHGLGGTGKTRLLIEVIEALRQQGWLAGFINRDVFGRERREDTLRRIVVDGKDATGLLLVLDYAEGRPDEVKTLCRWLMKREAKGGPQARIVLLSRGAGTWWETLKGNEAVSYVFGIGEETMDEQRLSRLADGNCRIDLWQTCVAALAPRLESAGLIDSAKFSTDPKANVSLIERLKRITTETDYERPLAVAMEALLWLRSSEPDASERGIPPMLKRICMLEREHWLKATPKQDPTALARGVAQVTAVQGVVARDPCIGLLLADSYFDKRSYDEAAATAGDLATLYGDDHRIAPLEPDLIGEHVVAEVVDNRLIEACLTWASDSQDKRRSLLTVLNRATRPEHGGEEADRTSAVLAAICIRYQDELVDDLIATAITAHGRLARILHSVADRIQNPRLVEFIRALPMRAPALASVSSQVVRTPIELLNPGRRIVPFSDHQGLLGDLERWCVSGELHNSIRRFEIRLVQAPGGLGKTRLLIELCDRLEEKDWIAGFLPRADSVSNVPMLERIILDSKDARPIFLAIDYAEVRQEEIKIICNLLARRSSESRLPCRLALLARSFNPWWDYFSASLPVQFVRNVDATSAIDIREPQQPESRMALFLHSVEKLREALISSAIACPREISGAKLEEAKRSVLRAGHSPLRIQSLALALLLGSDSGPGAGGREELPTDLPEALAALLSHERVKWAELCETEIELDLLTRVVAQIYLVSGVSDLAQARNLMALDCLAPSEGLSGDADVVLLKIRQLYGGIGGSILPIAPDLFGEALVNIVADEQLINACLEFSPENARNVLTILNRATRPEHGASSRNSAKLLRHVIQRDADRFGAELVFVALSTPGKLSEILPAQADSIGDVALESINFALPMQHLSWMEFSLRVAERYAELARKQMLAVEKISTHHDQRDAMLKRAATACDILGIRLSNLGRREDALKSSQEAVAIYRALAKNKPDAFLPDLAGSLNNLGGDLSNLGRREDALKASQEAVDIYQALAKDRPDAFLPDLASSLNNLGIRRSNLGRREEALKASQEAVDIYRALAKDHPDAFLPDLASSLNNLGGELSNLGRREEALKASQEAVDIYQALAKYRPDAFLPNLAGSLNNLGIRLSNLGRREDALKTSQEAVDIYRALAKDRPDAFLPDLASSLNNLGGELSNLGRREEALKASQEAVDIYRALANDRPDAFLPDLASSLNNLGAMLSNLGRREEALKASQEAVDIRRALARDRPDAFLPDLAMSLNNLGGDLSNLGRREDALKASQEAVDIYRALAKDRPDAFLPDLAGSLNNLGIRLSNLGRREGALKASQEAVDIRRALAKDRPDAFLPDLAMSLGALSQSLAGTERYADAAATAREGIATIAPFAEARPRIFGDLARTLGRHYINACEKVGIEPDNTLLERVARALGSETSDQAYDKSAALEARVRAIFDAAEATGIFDERALSQLPSDLALQIRDRWATRSNG